MILCNYEHNVTGEASFLRLEFIERMTYQLRGCEGVSTVIKFYSVFDVGGIPVTRRLKSRFLFTVTLALLKITPSSGSNSVE